MESTNENQKSTPLLPAPTSGETPASQTPALTGNESESAGGLENGKRIVKSASHLVFFTDTDEANYPIYITNEREVWLKAKPHRKVLVRDGWGYETTKKVYDIPVLATFFVKEVKDVDVEVSHDLLNDAIEVMKEVTKEESINRYVFEIIYEVYRGDMGTLIGEAKAYCIKIISPWTPFSGVNFSGRKAWAVGYDWKKRIIAKKPELEQYTYIKGSEGKKGRASVRVFIKLPVVTEEFEKLFNIALANTNVSATLEIEEQIRKLEETIRMKEEELEALRKELEALKLKLSLEQAKKQIITP